MKMQIKITLTVAGLIALIFTGYAFKPAQSKTLYTQITTIESVVPADLEDHEWLQLTPMAITKK